MMEEKFVSVGPLSDRHKESMEELAQLCEELGIPLEEIRNRQKQRAELSEAEPPKTGDQPQKKSDL